MAKDKQRIFIENDLGPFDRFLWLNLANLNSSNDNDGGTSSTEINQMIKSLETHRVPIDIHGLRPLSIRFINFSLKHGISISSHQVRKSSATPQFIM